MALSGADASYDSMITRGCEKNDKEHEWDLPKEKVCNSLWVP